MQSLLKRGIQEGAPFLNHGLVRLVTVFQTMTKLCGDRRGDVDVQFVIFLSEATCTLLSACSERAFCAFKLQELGTRVSFSVQMYPYGIHIHRRS